MDDFEKKALENIEKYGCHILHVLEEENYPCFSYSVGIEKTLAKPELIVLGLKSELAQSIINEYYRPLKEKETFEGGKFYAGFLEGFNITFTEVAPKHYPEYFGWNLWLYKKPGFRVLQMVWPTTAGKWPWDQDRPEYYQWCQPILNESGLIQGP